MGIIHKGKEIVTDRDGNEWPEAYTVDNVLIVPGLEVLDYNRRVSKVTDRKPSLDNQKWDDNGPVAGTGTYWFDTTGGLFDGSRMLANYDRSKNYEN